MSQDNNTPALLLLEDGQRYWGRSVGAPGDAFGELVFNTSMTGYQEVLTDPSYRGQIVVMTYPEIGIYGVNAEDVESGQIQVAGFVVHRAVKVPFNYRANRSLTDYLAGAGIVALEGVDTRALTRHLRTFGAMRGVIATASDAEVLDPERLLARVHRHPKMGGLNLAAEVTSDGVSPLPTSPHWGEEMKKVTALGEEERRVHIVVIDAGCKGGIVRDLVQRGVTVTVVPYDADTATVLALAPDGVLISNGPGDPEPLTDTIRTIQELIKARVPLAGICLGHQLLGLAAGGQTYKMRFGHRGANHPIKDMRTGEIVITTQNHGFAVDPTSLGIEWAPIDTAFAPARPELAPGSRVDQAATMAEQLPKEPLIGECPSEFGPNSFGPIEVTHLSLNDGTVEGLRLLDYPAFSVQFHPEASPGPHDAKGFFATFMAMVDAKRSEGAHA
ncbi:MAG: glutamine-hydrolyzing carbamoyl-phosphate synthase small subunit [Anaerolineae bacterium]|jgi:carbamoyl-phosphate synthase small subunit|nr:glutamine-hydrolyzing carbamoyl-phosphate synthase small subunit [Anaerolineae bacterium]